MQVNIPNLFIEISYSDYIFIAGIYDESQNFKIIEKLVVPNKGISENKITDIIQVEKIIKENINIIEDKLDFIFKEVIIVSDVFNYTSLNFSGFKKLNGSLVLKENISYILNSLKLTVTEIEKKNTILHIFNSKSILDGTHVENLPIGLYGDFYNHELSFFLIGNNDLKNIRQIFTKNNLSIKRILLKSFIEGSYLVNQIDNNGTFFKIKIGAVRSQIIFFEKSSFVYSENFNFGSNIILKDIEKVCSINNDIITNMLLDRFFKNKSFSEDDLLEEKYFKKINYRKIRKKLIKDIVDARIQEITNLILNKNVNLNFFKKDNKKIFITIEDELMFDNFSNDFKLFFSHNQNLDTTLIKNFDTESLIGSAANISAFGWKKEAIPITYIKNSLITKIFKYIFG